jgi:hypothetical protein
LGDRRDQLRSFTDTIARPIPIGILILGIVIIAIIAIMMSGASSSPEKTVKDFVSSRIKGNESKAAELTVEGSVQDFLGAENALAGTNTVFSVSILESDSESATVEVHFAQGDESTDVPYACKRVSGKWKVDLAGTEALWMEETP